MVWIVAAKWVSAKVFRGAVIVRRGVPYAPLVRG